MRRSRFLIAGGVAVALARTLQGAEPSTPGIQISSSIVDFNDLDTPVQMLEQEFDPSLLENLTAPTTAPAQVRLPPTLMEAGQWRGSLCGIAKPAHAVFRKPEEWDKFWTLAIKPYLSHPTGTPPVDFSKDMVVGVFMGENPFPGALIEIRWIEPDKLGGEQVLAVSYRNASKMQAVFTPPFPVQPFHLKKIPAFPGHVMFYKANK